MKKTKIILCLLLVFCFIACDNEDFDTPVGTLMSRESAYNRIKKDIKHSLKDVDIWASKKPIPANTTIVYGPNSFLSPDTEAWCFFVDEQPTADWDHDCQYILVDAKHQIHTMDKQLEPNNLYEDYDLINISDIRKNVGGFVVQEDDKVDIRKK